MHETNEEEESGSHDPTSAVLRVARKASGTHEIDVRAGFKRALRMGVANALECYRDAQEACAAGDTAEAAGLLEAAQRSLLLAQEALSYLDRDA